MLDWLVFLLVLWGLPALLGAAVGYRVAKLIPALGGNASNLVLEASTWLIRSATFLIVLLALSVPIAFGLLMLVYKNSPEFGR